MRGKGDRGADSYSGTGITPAYAGKRLGGQGMCLSVWDHPRLCGEKQSVQQYQCIHAGSPPPMRGKDGKKKQEKKSHGITPAYAGKRGSVKRSSRATQDHPRLCGEKDLCWACVG